MAKKRYGMKPRALPVVSFKELEEFYNNKPVDTGRINSLFEEIGTEQARIEMEANAQQIKSQPQRKSNYPRTDYLEPVPKRTIK